MVAHSAGLDGARGAVRGDISMMDYKDWWAERYAELSYELFGKEYWELMPDERVMLGDRMDDEAKDWMSSQIDAATDRNR